MTGKNKKMNFPILKTIRINEDQNKQWNAKNIRHFLDSIEIREKKKEQGGDVSD